MRVLDGDHIYEDLLWQRQGDSAGQLQGQMKVEAVAQPSATSAQLLLPQPAYLTGCTPITDAVDDDAPIVVSQELNGLEACNSRLNQVCLGIAQQLVNATRHQEAGGVVGEDRVAQSQDQCFRA